jgi:hypothetical protein
VAECLQQSGCSYGRLIYTEELVTLEAIASGLPAIVSNQAPFTEFLSPHQALLVIALRVLV